VGMDAGLPPWNPLRTMARMAKNNRKTRNDTTPGANLGWPIGDAIFEVVNTRFLDVACASFSLSWPKLDISSGEESWSRPIPSSVGTAASRQRKYHQYGTRTMDRSHYSTRKLRLEDEHGESKLSATPEECVEMVWPLTLQAWEFATWNQPKGEGDESRLRRDVGRVVRPAG
jgi:hypothetical protein